uniref:Uncharacterized protein n=1 Tax=Oryza nivara TaxID=4536 RepID=A0A0E0FL35_ORYNI
MDRKGREGLDIKEWSHPASASASASALPALRACACATACSHAPLGPGGWSRRRLAGADAAAATLRPPHLTQSSRARRTSRQPSSADEIGMGIGGLGESGGDGQMGKFGSRFKTQNKTSLADTPTPRLSCRSSSHNAASPLSLTWLLLCTEEYEEGGGGSAGGARYGERHTSPYRALRPWNITKDYAMVASELETIPTASIDNVNTPHYFITPY